MKRKKLLNIILKKLKLAHPDISDSETKEFDNSLYKFSDKILKTIVVKRLDELIANPTLKR